MAELTKDVALHDDPNSKKHADDKRAAAERRKTHYAPEPAIEVKAGASIIDGIFKSPVMGFSFRLKAGTARKVDGPAYTKEVLAVSKKRARYTRIRMRDGKERKDYGQYKHGGVSLITTMPPWAVGVVSRIGPMELEDLMLRLAEAQARRIEEMSGRPTYGGGAHLDTAVPHWHSHILKTAEDGTPYPKATFLTGGKWLCGATRVERKFPGLLSKYKRDRIEKTLARKRRENMVDLAATEAIDTALEAWIRERGLWPQYERDCVEYERKKIRAQQDEPLKRITQAGLGHYARTGIWPLAYQAMSLGMWRLIPRELRVAISLSIRAYQIIRTPKRAFSLVPKLVGMALSPEITQPKR